MAVPRRSIGPSVSTYFGGTERSTHEHSSVSSSHSSIPLNLESRNALMRAYSASPSLSGWGSKVPMQPRSLCGRPGREDRVFQVTKRGLEPCENRAREPADARG